MTHGVIVLELENIRNPRYHETCARFVSLSCGVTSVSGIGDSRNVPYEEPC